jgi:hypothetical protein
MGVILDDPFFEGHPLKERKGLRGRGGRESYRPRRGFYEDERALTAFEQMDSTAVVLGKKEFDALLERNSILGIKLFRLFGQSVALRLRDAQAKIVEDASHVRASQGFIRYRTRPA